MSVPGIRAPRGPKVEAMEDLMWPFGRDTEMPLFVGQMSRSTAASGRAIKLPVVPVSALIEWVETEDNDCWSDKL